MYKEVLLNMKIVNDICVYIANHIISSLYKKSYIPNLEKFKYKRHLKVCVSVGGRLGYCLPIELLTNLTSECWLE